MKNEVELKLESAEWIAAEVDRLLAEYRKCRTENCKALIEKKLRGLQGKLNYEGKELERLMNNES